MTNVEKVIKGLRCLTGMPRCDTCPYSNNPQRQYCLYQIGEDAIKLLKEQEKLIEEAREEGFKEGQINIIKSQN